MAIEFEDRTGQMRHPHEFHEAYVVVGKYLVNMKLMQFPDLMVQLGVVLDALKIAETVAVGKQIMRERQQKNADKGDDNARPLPDTI